MLSNKIYRKYGDIWGELFRIKTRNARLYRTLDIYGRRLKNNTLYYRFSFYVGRFGVVRRRKTRYGQAFSDKQKLKIFYANIRESHLRYRWAKSLKYRDHALLKFFHYLESRIDVLLYRSNLAFNMAQAGKLVENGIVLVNNKIMWDKTYMVRPFDLVTLKPRVSIINFLCRLLDIKYKMFPIPSYIEIDYKTLTILYTGVDAVPYYPFKFVPGRLRTLYR